MGLMAKREPAIIPASPVPAAASTTAQGKSTMWLSLEANIGAGKSTVMDKLSSALQHVRVVSEPVREWHDWLPLFYADRQRWGFPFQMKVLLSLSSLQGQGKLITERSSYSCRHVFGQLLRDDGCMSDPEWQLFQDYHDLLCKAPDHMIYLDAPPEVCEIGRAHV